MATAIFDVKSIFFYGIYPLKVTKEKATENRAALVHAAGRLFRERGIDGVGVAEISKKAGLTHGALYAQFPSKEALAAAKRRGVDIGATGRALAKKHKPKPKKPNPRI